MKRMYILCFAIAFVGLGSCKKDWTCTCAISGKSNQTYQIEGLTKTDAITDCNNKVNTLKSIYGSANQVSCSI